MHFSNAEFPDNSIFICFLYFFKYLKSLDEVCDMKRDIPFSGWPCKIPRNSDQVWSNGDKLVKLLFSGQSDIFMWFKWKETKTFVHILCNESCECCTHLTLLLLLMFSVCTTQACVTVIMIHTIWAGQCVSTMYHVRCEWANESSFWWFEIDFEQTQTIPLDRMCFSVVIPEEIALKTVE